MSYSHINGVMVDIETLGTKAGCVVMTIGAARFNIDTREIDKRFYTTIDIDDSLSRGFITEKETVQWWKAQHPRAIESLQRDKQPVVEAIKDFGDFILSAGPKAKVWAWGAHFDIPILEAYFNKVLNQPVPWKYYNVMDARTVANLFGLKLDKSTGIPHHALDDVERQVELLINLLNPIE